jgi:uncharacterized protein with predicted RNA binding PUA domain
MQNRLYIDPTKKFAFIIDTLFGSNISQELPLADLEFIYSKRTGRIKHVVYKDKIIATLRPDGGIALTLEGASLLLKTNKIIGNCIIIRDDIKEFISNGASVFCKHVIFVGNNVKIGGEVLVLDENNNLLAVGRSILTSDMIKVFKRGVAVKIRHAIND